MSTYEFQSTLFRTANEMLATLVGEWLSAGGMNDRDTMLGFLSASSDEDLAIQCIETWGLDQPEGDETSWLENRRSDRSDVVRAFAELRRDFDKRFPSKE